MRLISVGTVLLLVLWLSACGGGDEQTSTSDHQDRVENEGRSAEADAGSTGEQKEARDNSRSREFEVEGGDNSVSRFGAEANEAERKDASSTVEDFFAAARTQDFEEQCSHVVGHLVNSLEELADPKSEKGGDQTGCIKLLSSMAQSAPQMNGPVRSLRVEGQRGFALFHGDNGVDYAVSMEREGDDWKIAGLVPAEL